jgi:uncharacterized metal-binding protein
MIKKDMEKKIIALSCSGASDLGELSDKSCRVIRKEYEDVNMNCLAKLGFGEKGLLQALQTTTALVIDGCPMDCGKNTLEANGINDYIHFRLTDFGLIKDKTSVNEENTNFVVAKLHEVLIN